MKEMKVKITFTEELLGTSPNNPAIHDEFIASKAPDAMSRAEEVETIGAAEFIEKSMTVFPKTEDFKPFLYDYQLKGLFQRVLRRYEKNTRIGFL